MPSLRSHLAELHSGLALQRAARMCEAVQKLVSSPWPLTMPDVAMLLEVDEQTAGKIIKVMRDAGRARLDGVNGRWIFR